MSALLTTLALNVIIIGVVVLEKDFLENGTNATSASSLPVAKPCNPKIWSCNVNIFVFTYKDRKDNQFLKK